MYTISAIRFSKLPFDTMFKLSFGYVGSMIAEAVTRDPEVLIISAGDLIFGWAFTTRFNDNVIVSIFIQSDMRGRGYGTALLRALKARESLGASALIVANEPEARHLNQKLGFNDTALSEVGDEYAHKLWHRVRGDVKGYVEQKRGITASPALLGFVPGYTWTFEADYNSIN
jgi:GNAT superfamily N-acetyltransferase